MSIASLLALAWMQFWQISLVILVVGVVARTVLRRRPHWAYAFWLLALVKCVTPPVWSSPTGLFSWAASQQVVESVSQDRGRDQGTMPVAAPQVAPLAAPADVTTSIPATTVEPVRTTAPSISLVLVGVWLAGTVGCLLVFAASGFVVRRRMRESSHALPSELPEALNGLRQRMGLRRPVDVVLTDSWGPALVGVIRPRIVLPLPLVQGRAADDLTPILAHEMVHLRRGDHFVALVQIVAQSVWWFHPLVWWMNREMNRTREMCCDEEVVAGLDYDPAVYAQTLLDIVRLRRQLRTLAFSPGMRPVHVTGLRLQHIIGDRGRFCCRAPGASWFVAALVALVLLPGAGLALSSNPADAPATGTFVVDPGAAPNKETETATTVSEKASTMAWTVIDGSAEKPLEGVQVVVEHVVDTPAGRKVVATTHHVTDTEGKYKVVLPPSETAQPTLGLILNASKDGYAPLPRMMYGFHHFERNKHAGVEFPFRQQKMYSGEEITGVIEDPQGKPLADQLVDVFSSRGKIPLTAARLAAKSERDEDDPSAGFAYVAGVPEVTSHGQVRTDAQGRFRFLALKNGTAQLSIAPRGFAPLSHAIGEKRGDIGAIRLQPGVRLAGRAVDTAGKPVAGVWVNLREVTKSAEIAVAAAPRLLSRAAQTAADGTFQLDPVPPGKYRAHISSQDEGSELTGNISGELPAAFDGMVVDVPAAGEPPAIEFRAIPHATINAAFVDSAGNPFAGGNLIIEGRRGKQPYSRLMRSDAQGRIKAVVPRDLKPARLSPLMDEESVYMARRNEQDKWKFDDRVVLNELAGTDDKGDGNATATANVEFRRLRAPAVWLKVVDSDGKPVAGEVTIAYSSTAAGKAPSAEPHVDVFQLGKGIWRTFRLMPDKETVLTIKVPGYQTATHSFKLSEGGTEDVEVKLVRQED